MESLRQRNFQPRSDRRLPPILFVKVVQLGADHAEVERLHRVVAVGTARGWWLASIVRPVLSPATLCGPDTLETPLDVSWVLEPQGLVDGGA